MYHQLIMDINKIMDKTFTKIFDKPFILYIVMSLLMICIELYAFKFKQPTLAISAMIGLLVCNILYFLGETIIKPLIKILQMNDAIISGIMVEIKTNARFLRTQNNDFIANNITPITTILIGAIAYNNLRGGHLAILIASLTLLSCMVASCEIYVRVMTNRLIEQINFKGRIIGEVNIQEQKFLIKFICYNILHKVDVSRRLLFINLMVIISTFYSLITTTL